MTTAGDIGLTCIYLLALCYKIRTVKRINTHTHAHTHTRTHAHKHTHTRTHFMTYKKHRDLPRHNTKNSACDIKFQSAVRKSRLLQEKSILLIELTLLKLPRK